ncbi:MAG: hypothetical protein NTU51_10955 [Bacteroidetes bacterium]|nr:hypothetical protein [Bacteroidota bacterium]
MKKSSIILVIAGIILISWLVVLQIISARAINDYSSGRPSKFALSRAHILHNPRNIRRSLPLFTEVEVRGNLKVGLIMRMGPSYSLNFDTLLADRVKTHMEYDKLVIDLSGYSDKDEGVYTMTAPLVNKIRLNHIRDVNIREFINKDITVSANDVYPLMIKHCSLGTLTLESKDALTTQFIEIDSTNTIGHLSILMNGKGTLRLGTTGTLSTKIRISDSIDIITTGRLFKQLDITGPGK